MELSHGLSQATSSEPDSDNTRDGAEADGKSGAGGRYLGGWGSPIRGEGSQGGSLEEDPRLRTLLPTRTGWNPRATQRKGR